MIYAIFIGVVVFFLVLLLTKNAKQSYELRKQNTDLKKEVSSLEEKSKVRQQFISNLSSELRTPLYGIIGLTNLLSEEHESLKDDQNIKSLKFSGDYLLTLINNVLQVNNMDASKIATIQKNFDLKSLTQNLASTFRYATENTNNNLHYEFDGNIAAVVNGDQVLVSQILMNLINNALRFTRKGNVYFNVYLVESSETSNTVSFLVKYDGFAISKEDRQSIYDEFTEDSRSKDSYLGTGINSTIINRLADASGGKIVLNKQNEKSTESIFTIRFAIGDELENDNMNKPKVLIVDDNKISLMVTDKFMEQENFDCTTVDNGAEAIELVRKNDFDLILMDINMPVLNGVGATKKIREFNTTVPIIAFTAVDVTQLNEQMLRAGLNDYILKPFDKNVLLEKINTYVKTGIKTYS